MEEVDQDFDFGFGSSSPALVSLSHFTSIASPAPRRLSSMFSPPSQPVHSARRMSYVSLQGRLVNAEEASSSRAIGGSLSREEAVAWELFSPTQRFLIVAVIGVAVAESKKNRIIWQLRKNVELRDQVLSNMQQKLDNLCEKLLNAKDQPVCNIPANKKVESHFKGTFGSDKIKFVDCGCWHCDEHHDLLSGLMDNADMKSCSEEEIMPYKAAFTSEVEQEERRMSDLSDWSSSMSSAAEIQLENLAIERDDILQLKKECEEKDATIKELTFSVQSAKTTGSMRISELEDIIRRKNTTITRLKKDMMILEQKVVHLTRLRRSSYSEPSSSCQQHSVTINNVLYDMDSTTSPSSSDSDCSPVNTSRPPMANLQLVPAKKVNLDSPKDLISTPAKSLSSSVKRIDRRTKSQSVSPLTEVSLNQKINTPSNPRQRRTSASGDIKKSRRQLQTEATPQKRWV